MPKLADTSIPIVEGKIVLSKRKESPRWQARFRIGNRWIRYSTKTADLIEAKSIAADAYMEARFKEKNDLPIITCRFKSVAEAVKQRLQTDLDNKVGPVVNRDYIQAIDNWLIPFFGNLNVATIEHSHIKRFYAYRQDKLGRNPARSTVNTHCTALSRVFSEAVAQEYMSESRIPAVRVQGMHAANGRRGTRRPDFSIDEYRKLYRFMRSWISNGKTGKPTDMRYLMRDYVLFLANSGIRHGTESHNLKWNAIQHKTQNGRHYLYITVNGKVGERHGWARSNAKRYLERILERAEDMKGLTFEEAINQDKYVFRLPDGTRTKNLDQTFRKCLKDSGLLQCPRSDQNRSLYSLRHFYITQLLLSNKVSPLVVARQCGTSVLMLDKHYFHLDVIRHREELTGH